MSKKNISRKEALKQMGGLALGSTFLSPLASASEKPESSFPNIITSRASDKPNVLWITAEGVPISVFSSYQNTRWGDLRSSLVDTPNIDRIAKEGLLFQNSFCTNALCAPSRATLLTGKYAHLNGMMTNPGARSTAKKPSHFDPSQQTFSKIMRNHGYQTAVMGKWHLRLKNGKPTNPAKVGFDKFAFKTGAGGPYYDPHGYLQNPSMRSTKIEKKSHKGYITDIFTDMAIKTMKEFNGNSKPFLMMMQFFSDHRPFDPPHKYKNLYEGQRIPEPSTFWDEYQTRPALNTNQLRIEGMQDFNPPSDLTDRQRKQYNYQHLLKHFLGTLKAQDDNIGRLLDYLDRSGVAENTIVVYTSDHGSFLGEHGLFDKRFMYEQSIRVPWMIRYPGIAEKGSKTEKWSINIDNAPTILDLVNLPVPDDMQGKSLKPIIQGKSFSNWQHNLYYHYFEKHWALPNYGIRTERYKLINYYTINQWELYDLKKDPDEMENLFIMTDLFSYDKYKTKPGYKSVVGDLLKRLYKLSRKYKDTTVKPVNLKPV